MKANVYYRNTKGLLTSKEMDIPKRIEIKVADLPEELQLQIMKKVFNKDFNDFGKDGDLVILFK